MPSDLDAAIRERLAKWGEDPCGYATCVVVGWPEMKAAILAVLEMKRRNGEDWTHLSETAYEAGRRWALEQAVGEIAKALGIAVGDA